MDNRSDTDTIKDDVTLRDVVPDDLTIFFDQQKDPESYKMAAFTTKDPSDQTAFREHWNRILSDEKILIKTTVYQGEVAGYVLSYEQSGKRNISYWIGKAYWGKGIATQALRQYLAQVTIRPLYARAAKDNVGSIRVLEKCGFQVIGDDKGFSNARGEMIAEFIFKLEVA